MPGRVSSQLSTRAHAILVLTLIGVLAAQLVFSIRQQSQTWDEGAHIAAGYQYWRNRDFGANPEHSPLVKLVAAIPLLRFSLKEPLLPPANSKLTTIIRGMQFLYGNDADVILFRARLAVSVFTYLLAVLVFLCGYEMFGSGPALLALVLLVFEPNILANGALVTTDVGETCFMFASVYAFYRYVKRPSIVSLLICGCAVAFALAAKHSGILLVPILVLLVSAELDRAANATSSANPKRYPTRLDLAIVAVLAIGYVNLWAFSTSVRL